MAYSSTCKSIMFQSAAVFNNTFMNASFSVLICKWLTKNYNARVYSTREWHGI